MKAIFIISDKEKKRKTNKQVKNKFPEFNL